MRLGAPVGSGLPGWFAAQWLGRVRIPPAPRARPAGWERGDANPRRLCPVARMSDDNQDALTRALAVVSAGVIAVLLLAAAYWVRLEDRNDRHPWRCFLFRVGCGPGDHGQGREPASSD